MYKIVSSFNGSADVMGNQRRRLDQLLFITTLDYGHIVTRNQLSVCVMSYHGAMALHDCSSKTTTLHYSTNGPVT